MSGSAGRMDKVTLPGASSRNPVLISKAQRQALRVDIRQRLVTALTCSGDAVTDPKLARLPGPVRYRVTGALAAWDALRAATDRVASPTLTEMLRSHGILRLTRYFDRFTRDLLSHGADGRPPDVLAGVAQYSPVWLAFEVRKMLLYLNARDAQVVQDRAYSNAPRHFPGLGKRKRTERLAEIEQLYDRHVVGPAILDAEAAGSVPSDSAQREVSDHWRRPHFRMQPYGPQAALRKLIFVGPTLVRPDRLGL
ncbi:hypothetical protein [Burkholderia cenocepacia]|uniref:hypothetical protein n=1 Tax=Burkholderia cenocepacia TaxID=95486 RepID=UPI002DDD3EED|nr:hypothetical protein [Burkholderia cenocepacia]MEC4775164.1 hypothetical protein [Burkholderia cenocepacia]